MIYPTDIESLKVSMWHLETCWQFLKPYNHWNTIIPLFIVENDGNVKLHKS